MDGRGGGPQLSEMALQVVTTVTTNSGRWCDEWERKEKRKKEERRRKRNKREKKERRKKGTRGVKCGERKEEEKEKMDLITNGDNN